MVEQLADNKSSCFQPDTVKPLVVAETLGISYTGAKKRSDDFKSHTHNLIVNLFKKKQHQKSKSVWALQDVSFEGFPGDIIGVIGSNGAGKTTLCRAVLGMIHPDQGRLITYGETSSLLTLGAGFDLELTGRENIYMNGMMLGMSRKKINKIYLSIVEFSGIDRRFIDMPIKHYSSGMKARLGFSVAAALEAEIMIIDEVLGAGDLAFQEKAAAKIRELVSSSKMALVVAHNTSFIENFCTRALWIEEGSLMQEGEPAVVAGLYREYAAKKCERQLKRKKMIDFPETSIEIGQKKAIDIKELGVCFKVRGKPYWALKEVSFDVYEKEILGIIGPNGAGKTTLCRTLCGLYRGDYGRVYIDGMITALLSFGAGFDQQLDGLSNIYLNGMMLGLPRQQIKSIEQDIVEFAELGSHIHKAVKYYSSGMRSRLGFSIATNLNPDVLIVDEALSAGDIVFQEKAAVRMQEMLEDAKTVVIVSHNLPTVEKLCTRVIWLQQGQVKYDGDPYEAVALYRDSVEANGRKQVCI